MDMTQHQTGTPAQQGPRELVVVGGGMVARRLIDALRSRDDAGQWAITLLCEEPRAPYDRVALTSYFTGRDPEDLALGGQEIWEDPLVTIRRGVAATSVDREARTVDTSDGRTLPYDSLVLATGSYAAVPRSRARTCEGRSSTAPSTTSRTCAPTSRRCAARSTGRFAARSSVGASSASRPQGRCGPWTSSPRWSSSPPG